MTLSGKTWAAAEALGSSHRTDHNTLSHTAGVSVLAYGAGTAESGATNTAAIQAALDAETIVVVPAGTFNLDTAGTNPYAAGHKYCLDLPSNVRLVLLPGAVLQLANGQQTDAGGAVDIVVGQSVSNTTITGRGSILGNTAGQTGWTGGYGQGHATGAIVAFFGDCTDITIEDVTLGDHWSCAVEFGSDAGRNTRVWVRGVYAYNVGEGLQFVSSDDCGADDCVVADVADVFVGDGIEWSKCTNFRSVGCVLTATNGANGSAFDVFGSTEGQISGFTIDGWDLGFDINNNGATVAENVVVSDGVMTDVLHGGLVTSDPSASGVVCRGLTMQGRGSGSGGVGLQVDGGGTPIVGPVTVDGCVMREFGSGIIAKTVSELAITGGSYVGNQVGIVVYPQEDAATAADCANLSIVGVAVHGAVVGVQLQDNSTTGKEPTGGIIGNILTGNTAGYQAIGTAADSLTVTANAT